MNKMPMVGVALVLASGCTSYRVTPLVAGHANRKVVIVDNPLVVPRDVGPRLQTEFRSRGFDAEYKTGVPVLSEDCLMVTYDVRRAFNIWAPKPWVNYISVKISDRQGNLLADALYKHRMGALSLNFGALCPCARTKARPLFEALFKDYPRVSDMEF